VLSTHPTLTVIVSHTTSIILVTLFFSKLNYFLEHTSLIWEICCQRYTHDFITIIIIIKDLYGVSNPKRKLY